MNLKPETANQITANIIRVVNMQPKCVAARINVVGIFDKNIGTHRKSNATKGVEDVVCCVYGLYVGFEVKAGNDMQSEYQKRREFEIKRAGGKYYIIRSTDEFLQIFTQILNELKK